MANIQLTVSQLEKIVTRAMNVGRVEILNSYLPQSKYISRPQLINYLRMLGIKGSQLADWEERGLIHDIQTGSGGTHKYPMIEIQKLLLQLEIAHA